VLATPACAKCPSSVKAPPKTAGLAWAFPRTGAGRACTRYIAIPQRRHDGRSQKQLHIGHCPATGMEPAPRAMPPIPSARVLWSQGHAVRRMRRLLGRESIGPKSKMGCIRTIRHAILAPCRRLVESYTGDSTWSRAAGPGVPSFPPAGTNPIPPNFSAIASCASLSHHAG
jgi:hypothetical protein